MEPGRELDALVAEKVMGWEQVQDPPHTYIAYNTPTGFRLPEEIPAYSTDLNAAWKVVEAMRRRGFWCQMRTPFGTPEQKLDDGCWAGFTPHGTSGWNGKPDNWTSAPTAPHAICLAALKAVGVEVGS